MRSGNKLTTSYENYKEEYRVLYQFLDNEIKKSGNDESKTADENPNLTNDETKTPDENPNLARLKQMRSEIEEKLVSVKEIMEQYLVRQKTTQMTREAEVVSLSHFLRVHKLKGQALENEKEKGNSAKTLVTEARQKITEFNIELGLASALTSTTQILLRTPSPASHSRSSAASARSPSVSPSPTTPTHTRSASNSPRPTLEQPVRGEESTSPRPSGRTRTPSVSSFRSKFIFGIGGRRSSDAMPTTH